MVTPKIPLDATHTEETAITPPEPPETPDALRAFEASIALYTYQGGVVWASFNAMIVVHSILVATAAVVITGIPSSTNQLVLRCIVGFIAFIGFLVSVVWLAITSRGIGYQDDIRKRAEDIEKMYFPIQIFPFKAILDPKLHGIDRLRVRPSTYTVIGLFGFLYIGAFIISMVVSSGFRGVASIMFGIIADNNQVKDDLATHLVGKGSNLIRFGAKLTEEAFQ